MIEATREDDYTIEFGELDNSVEARVRNAANRIDSIRVMRDDEEAFKLRFGTVDGADKMIDMLARLA